MKGELEESDNPEEVGRGRSWGQLLQVGHPWGSFSLSCFPDRFLQGGFASVNG